MHIYKMMNFLKDGRSKLAKTREKSARKSKNIKDYQKKNHLQ